MKNYLLQLDSIDWIPQGKGLRCKAFSRGDRRIRLLEFSEGFVEADWCTKGHIGYVLEGSLVIDFNGRPVKFQKGEGIWIEAGEQHRHKAVIGEGEKALLLLVEDISNT